MPLLSEGYSLYKINIIFDTHVYIMKNDIEISRGEIFGKVIIDFLISDHRQSDAREVNPVRHPVRGCLSVAFRFVVKHGWACDDGGGS